MRDFDESDPHHIVAVIIAAIDLSANCEPNMTTDDRKTCLAKIARLRAGAAGLYEARELLRGSYTGRRAADAWHDARKCIQYAKSADKCADRTLKHLRIPYEFEGGQQSTAKLLWWAYRDLHIEVKDDRVCWHLAAFAGAKARFDAIPSAPQKVALGGTPEALAAWNAGSLIKWNTERDAARLECNQFEAQLITVTTIDGRCPHWERDRHMLYLGRNLSGLFYDFYLACENSVRRAA